MKATSCASASTCTCTRRACVRLMSSSCRRSDSDASAMTTLVFFAASLVTYPRRFSAGATSAFRPLSKMRWYSLGLISTFAATLATVISTLLRSHISTAALTTSLRICVHPRLVLHPLVHGGPYFGDLALGVEQPVVHLRQRRRGREAQ